MPASEGLMGTPQEYRNRISEKGYDDWGLTISSLDDANKALNAIKGIEHELYAIKKELRNEISILWDQYREQTKDSIGNVIAGAVLGKKRAYKIQKNARTRLAEERDRQIKSFKEIEALVDVILEQHSKNRTEIRDFKKELRRKSRRKSSYKSRSNKSYEEYIRSQEWREKAEEAKAKAGNRCQVCNRSRAEVQLDAHHRTYERLGNELPEDITVLCRDCHQLYEDSKKNKNSQNADEELSKGFCIRCKKTIKLEPSAPYCYACFKVWNKFQNSDYEEKYCHFCGGEISTSMKKPACYDCYKEHHPKFAD